MAELLELIRLLKEADRDGAVPQLLRGRSLGMIFEEPSRQGRLKARDATRRLPRDGYDSTIVLLIAAIFIKTQDSLYYAVFAASSVVFLLPYLLMFPAALALRIKDPDRPRPFLVPGGVKVLAALVAVTTIVIVATAVLFIWPEVPHRPADWSYTGPLLGIVVGALVAGEALIWRGVHPRRTPRAKPRPLGPAAASRP